MLHTKLATLLIGGLLAVVATGCIVSFQPETAVNPVGTEHTVTVTLRDPADFTEEAVCNIFDGVLDALEEIEELPPIGNPCDTQSVDTAQEDDIVEFEVISGPNAGTNSHEDGVCEPSCALLPEDRKISWTYESNGVAGTDVIEVCVSSFLLEPPEISNQQLAAAQLTEDELLELINKLLLDGINDEFGTNFRSLDEIACQQVEKTWEEPRRPNIGAGLSGLFAGQPTPLPTAVAPASAPVAPNQGIRPPNTGDGGLR